MEALGKPYKKSIMDDGTLRWSVLTKLYTKTRGFFLFIALKMNE